MSSFFEFEYKFKADDIKLEDFQALMEEIKYTSFLHTGSWDHYYTKKNKTNEFLRFRESEVSPELTKKIKLKNSNNFSRLEVDLPLDPKRLYKEGIEKGKVTIDKFAEMEDYKQNFSIYKDCFIYWQDSVNYVFYRVPKVIYMDNHYTKIVHTFIEVEMNKDKIQDTDSAKSVFKALNQAESVLKKLGLNPKKRYKKSLFEIYVSKKREII